MYEPLALCWISLVLSDCTARWLLPRPVWFWLVEAYGATLWLTSAMFSSPSWLWDEMLSAAMA
ncbi:hypothetical protein D3C71_2178090 [compost metagenome]